MGLTLLEHTRFSPTHANWYPFVYLAESYELNSWRSVEAVVPPGTFLTTIETVDDNTRAWAHPIGIVVACTKSSMLVLWSGDVRNR